MKRSTTFSIAIAILTMFAVSAFAQLAGPGTFDLSWHTIDGGGGRSSGGTFTIDATIGQPDAGAILAGGNFTLNGGFWAGAPSICPADITGNGAVNVEDLLAIIGAWGTCPGPCPPHCPADLNQNCTVNVQDLLAVIGAWGPCP